MHIVLGIKYDGTLVANCSIGEQSGCNEAAAFLFCAALLSNRQNRAVEWNKCNSEMSLPYSPVEHVDSADLIYANNHI